jgi:hypothetical protein
MKHIIVLVLLTYFGVGKILAQSDQEVIKNIAEKYVQAFKDGDMKTIANSLYPKMFDVVPREMVEQKMNETVTDSKTKAMMPAFESTHIGKISKILVMNDVKYAVVQYGGKMNFPTNFSADEANFMKKMLEEDKRYKNVQYNATTQKITADLNAEMFAIYNREYGEWKFLEKKENTKNLLSTFLSKKEVVKLYKLK